MSRRVNPETILQGEILEALGGREDVRLFRNNGGVARRRLANGELSRPIKFGLAPGSSDLIGLVRPWGVLLSVEVKVPGKTSNKKQLAWAELVRRFGGIHFVAHSAEEAVRHLELALVERDRALVELLTERLAGPLSERLAERLTAILAAVAK